MNIRESVDRFLGHPLEDQMEYDFAWVSIQAGIPVETLELTLLAFSAGRQLGRAEGFNEGYDACEGYDR